MRGEGPDIATEGNLRFLETRRTAVVFRCCNGADKIPRGPEVETWLGAEEGTDPAVENDWGLLPFMALSDGAHA
jgi:hypothetical protein